MPGEAPTNIMHICCTSRIPNSSSSLTGRAAWIHKQEATANPEGSSPDKSASYLTVNGARRITGHRIHSHGAQGTPAKSPSSYVCFSTGYAADFALADGIPSQTDGCGIRHHAHWLSHESHENTGCFFFNAMRYLILTHKATARPTLLE
ncbi:hypothetical protein CPAR01_05426 [Colletotrichum paranaense]|uniref:Uncharacterized protein n=1 Tax=Colletotrichum paranaense TaxID=1914294 RepID=A0ABQ9SR99_9PEZI|nr:uncharacterized protein CPAR01_05426 [Colletotrichum paranaense]KAK1542039.1 hypothetical protein CPAR01_05426 [Colletotrichum paranaense]